MHPNISKTRSAIAILGVGALALTGCADASGDDASDSIKIGVIVPKTGPASALGAVGTGIEAYFDDLNANGGIDGHEVEVIVKDDAYDPSKTPAQARALVEQDQVDMMCGPLGTGPTSAIFQYLTQGGVPTVAMSGDPAVAGPETTVFEQLPDYRNLGAYLADFVATDLNHDEVAIAYSPDGVGEPFRDGAEAQLEELGIEPTLVEFDPTSPDQSAAANKLKESDAEVVLVNHVAPIVAALAKAAQQQGFEPEWASTFAVNDASFGELTGGVLDGIYVATPFLIGTESEAGEYREAVSALDGVDATDPVVIEGWSTADACAQVLAAAADTAGEKPSRDQILDAMTGISIETTYVRDVEWTDEHHLGQSSAQIIRFEDDEFVPFKAFDDLPTQ